MSLGPVRDRKLWVEIEVKEAHRRVGDVAWHWLPYERRGSCWNAFALASATRWLKQHMKFGSSAGLIGMVGKLHKVHRVNAGCDAGLGCDESSLWGAYYVAS